MTPHIFVTKGSLLDDATVAWAVSVELYGRRTAGAVDDAGPGVIVVAGGAVDGVVWRMQLADESKALLTSRTGR